MTELCLFQIIHHSVRDMPCITFRAIKHTWSAYAECPNTGSPARALPGLIFALTFWVCDARCHAATQTVVTEVCYLLEVSWQMCHAWITYWTVTRAPLTMPRRRSMCDKCMRGRNTREPFLARMRARLAPRVPIFES